MAEEFEPVTTQEQLDKIVNAKLEENQFSQFFLKFFH